jgi:hypothetical protein
MFKLDLRKVEGTELEDEEGADELTGDIEGADPPSDDDHLANGPKPKGLRATKRNAKHASGDKGNRLLTWAMRK